MDKSAHGRKGRSKAGSETPAVVPSDRSEPVNKAAEIRREARGLVLQGRAPRPIDIIARLKKREIEVTSAQVSTALAGTEFAYRRNREEWARPQSPFPEPALAFQLVGLEDVQMAKEFVDQIGSLEKAMAALVALQQFGGGKPRVDSPGPVIESCRIVPEKKAKPKPADEESAAES
jgi:hypothetical protein